MFRRKQYTWRHIYQTEEGKDIKTADSGPGAPAGKVLGPNLVLESEFERKVPELSCSCLLSSIVCMLPIFLLPQCASFTAEHRDGVSQAGRRQGRSEGERG